MINTIEDNFILKKLPSITPDLWTVLKSLQWDKGNKTFAIKKYLIK